MFLTCECICSFVCTVLQGSLIFSIALSVELNPSAHPHPQNKHLEFYGSGSQINVLSGHQNTWKACRETQRKDAIADLTGLTSGFSLTSHSSINHSKCVKLHFIHKTSSNGNRRQEIMRQLNKKISCKREKKGAVEMLLYSVQLRWIVFNSHSKCVNNSVQGADPGPPGMQELSRVLPSLTCLKWWVVRVRVCWICWVKSILM